MKSQNKYRKFQLQQKNIEALEKENTRFKRVYSEYENMSTSCGILFNYFLSIWFVFERGKHSKKKEFVYFMGVSLVSTLFSLVFFQIFYSYIFKDNIDLIFYTLSPEMISKIAAILLVSILNYSVKKKVIFNG